MYINFFLYKMLVFFNPKWKKKINWYRSDFSVLFCFGWSLVFSIVLVSVFTFFLFSLLYIFVIVYAVFVVLYCCFSFFPSFIFVIVYAVFVVLYCCLFLFYVFLCVFFYVLFFAIFPLIILFLWYANSYQITAYYFCSKSIPIDLQ